MGWRIDYNTSRVCAAIAAMGGEEVNPSDIMPEYGVLEEEPKKKDVDEAEMFMMNFAAMHNLSDEGKQR